MFGTALLTVLGIATNAITAVTHTPTTPYGWYFVPNNTGTTPLLDPGMKFAEEHGGYYCDRRCEDGEKVIYLTFDAGYENGCTPAILEALKKHHVPATFFVVGNYIDTAPELVLRMVQEGHIVGNHTLHHPDMSAIQDEASFSAELNGLADKYRELTGEEMKKFYRPPQGKFSESNLAMAQKLGYRTVFWSLAYVDWYQDDQPTDEQAFSKLLPRIHPGAVVLLHSTSQTNARILDTLLSKWEEMGYSFGTLDELFA